MPFDFLGQFNKSQNDRFAAFARAQQRDVQARILHLTAEQIRVGTLVFGYAAGGAPTGYVPSPPDSYIGRLLACYEILGGDALLDLNLRSMQQPVFLLAGDETRPAQQYSNGEIAALPGVGDAETALLGQAARQWMPEVLQYKREYLERKIRRTIDYSDQLTAEMDRLQTILLAKDVEGSLEHIFDQVGSLINDPTYRQVYDDKGADPRGTNTTAPLLPYLAGPDREPNDNFGLDFGGATVPGQALDSSAINKANT